MRELRYIFACIVVCVLVATAGQPAYAQDSLGVWSQNLTNSARVYTMDISTSNGNLIYCAGLDSGVYKTTNGGVSWTAVNNGLTYNHVQTIAMSQSNNNILYCGTDQLGTTNSGVYKTTDGGANWTAANTGILETSRGIQTIVIHPTNPNIAWMSVFDGLVNSTTGLYKTTDGGATWVPSNNGIGTIKNFLAIAVNPLNPNTLYCGSSFSVVAPALRSRIYRSVDGGANWVDMSNGLPTDTTIGHPIRALSISTADTNVILAALFLAADTLGGAYVTTNGGALWVRKHTGLQSINGALLRACLIKPGSSSEFYVGLDGGTATARGVWRTTDGGASWSDFNNGTMSNTYTIRALVFKTQGNPTLYAGAANAAVAIAGRGVYEYSWTAPAVPAVLLANPGPANNGGSAGWAMFLNLIAGPVPINVTDMTTASTAAANATYSVEIFTRSGNALGGPVGSGPGSSPAGWTSIGTVPVTQGPTASGVSLLFAIPTIHINAHDTAGVAIRFNTVGPRYFGTGTPPYETYSDANLTLVTGDGRSAPFTPTGSWFASRALVGEIHYIPAVTFSHDLGVSSLTRVFAINRPSTNNQSGGERTQVLRRTSDVVDISRVSMDSDARMDLDVWKDNAGIDAFGSSVSLGLMTHFALADTVRFRAIVKNYGSSTEPSYQLGWRIDAVNQTPIARNIPLASGAFDTVLFQWNQATTGSHLLRAWARAAQDSNAFNDTASLAFSVGRIPGDTLYNFNILPSELLLGIAKLPSHKLVITSGGLSNTSTTDNKWIVTTMRGAILDSSHYQINNTAGQGFGFRDLAWDGRWLLASDNAQVRRIDTATFTEVRPPFTAPGTLQRGLAAETRNRIWKSNFTTEAVVRFDSTGVQTKTLGIPTVAPYGIAFDKWTSRNRGWLWYTQPSVAGQIKLSKVDTSSGAIVTTYDYSPGFPATSSSGGLDIVNDHPEYPGAVVALMVTQLGPGGIITAIYLGQDSTLVGVGEENTQIPQTFSLMQNYPNPFNPTTTIKYELPVQSDVTLKVYSVLGQEVATVVQGQSGAGHFEATWNGKNSAGVSVGTGVYFYKLEAKGTASGDIFTSIKKMLLLK